MSLDEWVVRTPLPPRPQREQPPAPNYTQLRITDCRAVVPLDRVNALRESLVAPGATPDAILSALQKLQSMFIALEILEETRIGQAVYRLRRHADPRVAALAEELYVKWRADAKDAVERRERKRARTERGSAGAERSSTNAISAGGTHAGGGSATPFVLETDLAAEMDAWSAACAAAALRPTKGTTSRAQAEAGAYVGGEVAATAQSSTAAAGAAGPSSRVGMEAEGVHAEPVSAPQAGSTHYAQEMPSDASGAASAHATSALTSGVAVHMSARQRAAPQQDLRRPASATAAVSASGGVVASDHPSAPAATRASLIAHAAAPLAGKTSRGLLAEPASSAKHPSGKRLVLSEPAPPSGGHAASSSTPAVAAAVSAAGLQHLRQAADVTAAAPAAGGARPNGSHSTRPKPGNSLSLLLEKV